MSVRQKKKIKVGVIGAGTWSHYAHFPAIQDHPDAELHAICQRTESRLKATAAQWNVPRAFTDYREMILSGGVDGVIVSTPHDVHYEPVKLALENGVHVLCEKPLVLKSEEAEELVNLAARNRLILLVGHPLPCIPQCREIRNFFKNGDLGEVKYASGLFASCTAVLYSQDPVSEEISDYFKEAQGCPYNANTYNSPERGGGQGHTMLSHAIHLAMWLTGLKIVDVYACMSNDKRFSVDAYDSVTYTFNNGALGNIGSLGTLSYKVKPIHDQLIHCENGTVILNLARGPMRIEWADGKQTVLPDIPEDMRWPQLLPPKNFIDVLLGRDEPLSTGETGLYTVKFIEGAYTSAAIGKPVNLYPAESKIKDTYESN